jgi:FkbM family methyltransferase
MVEVGAIPLDERPEPFHQLLHACPGSEIIAFEVDEAECKKLNERAPEGIRFFAQVLGRGEEARDFYVASAPMCSSLYPPNQAFCDLFHNLGSLVRTARTIRIDTVSLDYFARHSGIDSIDFIKIDVQGAELEIFQGGERILKNVLAIVSEVEFQPIYDGQPLYEEVSAYLRTQGFAFHKFLGLAGRTCVPVVINGNLNFPISHLWSDAVFIRDLTHLDQLSDAALFKLALLMECYGSIDVTHLILSRVDERRKSDFAALYLQRLLGTGA